jgi:hypothetical protein
MPPRRRARQATACRTVVASAVIDAMTISRGASRDPGMTRQKSSPSFVEPLEARQRGLDRTDDAESIDEVRCSALD